MRVLISGATGLIGSALVDGLQAAGHTPVRLVRGAPTGTDIRWDPSAGALPGGALDGVGAVVNLAGAGIGDKRWTDAYQREILDSRVRTTGALATAIADAGVDGPKVFLSGSAIGVYGNRGDEVLTERSAPGGGFLADVCRQWEAAAVPASRGGARVAMLRTALVLSAKGGALRKQLPLFRLGLGGKLGGDQWWSWIAIDDHVAATISLLTSDTEGPVNVASPHPVTNAEFTRTLGKVLRRPTVVPIPSFGPKLVLGRKLAQSLLFDGQRVEPAVLAELGFAWAHPTLEPALRAVLGAR